MTRAWYNVSRSTPPAMECPYCNTRNLPGAAVCNTCGAILRDIPRARPAPKERSGGGGFAGAARALFGGNKAQKQLSAVQNKIKTALETIDEQAAGELKNPAGASAQTRLTLGAAHLLKDEIERAMNEFSLAQKAGASGPEFWNNGAVALARRGAPAQAIDLLERAAQSSPEPALRRNLAHALHLAGRLPQARQAAEAALPADPQNPILLNRLGVLLVQGGHLADARARFEQARDAGKNTPSEADAVNNLGVVAAFAGDFAEAATLFQQALALEPAHARALCNQALLLLRQNEWEGATERLLRASRIDGRSGLVRSNLGYALSKALAINEGIREFKEAINLEPMTFEAWYNQGKSYADEGLYDIALRYLSRALQINAQSLEALVTMAVIKLGLGQTGEAIQHLSAARQIDPNNVSVLTGLGLCLGLSGDYLGAERVFQRAGQLAPQDPDINVYLGWLYLRQEQISQGLGECEIALGVNEKLALAHNNAGLCQVDLTNPQEGLGHFRRAQALDPALAPVFYNAGCALAAMKQHDSAAKEWELAAKAEPGNVDCFANLGVAYYKKEDWDMAVTEFRRVITLRQDNMADFSNLGLSYGKQGIRLKQASKKNDDPKAKEALERHRLAIEMFDRALALQPGNVMLHSNRGLACYFANRPEEAMNEWRTVTRINPEYARRRGQKMQTAFDESQVDFVRLHPAERALYPPLRTPDYLAQFVFGYDIDEWETLASHPVLASVPTLVREAHQLERAAAAS